MQLQWEEQLSASDTAQHSIAGTCRALTQHVPYPNEINTVIHSLADTNNRCIGT